MRIAVVGCGVAGPAAALLLARDGHEVEILERVADPRPVGAGILLQKLGQEVLAELGLADALERASTPIRHVDARTRSGRVVMDFHYDDAVAGSHAWGVHRGALFDLLWAEVARAGIPVRIGTEVIGLQDRRDGWLVQAADGSRGPYDVVLGADGARSRVRRLSGLTRKDTGYPYGALWTVVPDPEGLAGHTLFQRYDGTPVTLGMLPTGIGQVSIFWSIRTRDIPRALAAGSEAFVRMALPHAGPMAPLVARTAGTRLLSARYRDVVVTSPVLVRSSGALVLLGDAAHAMSPQLGLGASLALADAWALAICLRPTLADRSALPAVLAAYARSRADHVRWYTWVSRMMTPVFQSNLIPIGWGRDLLMGPMGRIGFVHRQLVQLLMGARTSPWSTWQPPVPPP